MNEKAELFLYSKADCSACDIFKVRLDKSGVAYYSINIAGDPELTHRYGARVPVLVAGNTELCEGIFDDQVITEYARSRSIKL